MIDLSAALLLLHPEDNLLVVRQPVNVGDIVTIEGEPVLINTFIGIGHKLARSAMTAGTPAIKFGARIGTMKQDVCRGDHVHLHNLASDYIATHGRSAGSLE